MKFHRPIAAGEAFDLLRNAIRCHDGFILVTGDTGTGKTRMCRALHEQVHPKTFTALVLNPPSTEQDLLETMLRDFGVISREDVKSGRAHGVTTQALVHTLHTFLHGLIPLGASAVLIIDEAHNLPLHLFEQIDRLSKLETGAERRLQLVLVGQSTLEALLRSPELRQLDQRVSVRYELQPLADARVPATCTPAGGTRAMRRVQRLGQRASLAAASLVVLLAAATAVGVTAWLYERYGAGTVPASERRSGSDIALPAMPKAQTNAAATRDLPPDTRATILAGSYPADSSDEGTDRLNRAAPGLDARAVAAAIAMVTR